MTRGRPSDAAGDGHDTARSAKGATWGEMRSTSTALRGIQTGLVVAMFTLVGIALLVAGVAEAQGPAVAAGVLFLVAAALSLRATRAYRRRARAIADVDRPSFEVNRPRDYLPEIRALLGAIGAVVAAALLLRLAG